jgi:hypothetical protein
VAEVDGALVEQRHDYGDDGHSRKVSGRIVGIAWRPAVLSRGADGIGVVTGYGEPVTVSSTDERPYDMPWAFEFTVDTDAPAPTP